MWRRDDHSADESLQLLLLLLLLLLLTRPGAVSCTELRGPHAKGGVGRSPTVLFMRARRNCVRWLLLRLLLLEDGGLTDEGDCICSTVPRTLLCVDG